MNYQIEIDKKSLPWENLFDIERKAFFQALQEFQNFAENQSVEEFLENTEKLTAPNGLLRFKRYHHEQIVVTLYFMIDFDREQIVINRIRFFPGGSILLRKESQFFKEQREELLKEHQGKFVLIKNERIWGIFETESDAIQNGYEQIGNEAFFVSRITEAQSPDELSLI